MPALKTTMPLLSDDLVATANKWFDREVLPVSVLHLGPGAFFRAHRMDYFDRLNDSDPRWGVAAVALRSMETADKLTPQNGVYTLVTLDEEISFRPIRSLLHVHHASEEAALSYFASAELKLLTMTITEKGYCLNASGELDLTNFQIAADIENPDAPKSAIGWITKGLSQRAWLGLPGLTILSCDNQPSNGVKLQNAILTFARKTNPALAEWIASNCTFPCSMVDSITPATDDELIGRVEGECGYHDAWPIQREAFTSWVIENKTLSGFPDLASVGAIMTSNVELHEKAKLRLLNGAHSTLAYVGLAYGYKSVAEGMQDSELRTFLRSMMTDEILPSLVPPEGMDLQQYVNDLIHRFTNPAIEHRLSQIAWDGSQKLPIRLLDAIRQNLAEERPIEKLSVGVAAWMRFIVRMTREEQSITDPMASDLRRIGNKATDATESDIKTFFRLSQVFGEDLPKSKTFAEAVQSGYDKILETENQRDLREARN